MLKINKHKINSRNLERLNLAHISDIHYTKDFDLNLQKNIIRNMKEFGPDYICITGDIIDYSSILDDKEISKNLLIFLESLSSISKVFIVLGSHDLESKNKEFNSYMKKWKELLKGEENIYLLDNEKYSDFRVNIIGITLPYNYYNNKPYENPRILNLELNKYTLDDKYSILLIHSPRRIFTKEVINNELLMHLDLVLSGHMHNGLMPKFLNKLPGSRGLISPSKSFFPKYARGTITKKINNHECKLIITGGILKVTPHMPFYTKMLKGMYNSEIELIEIRKKDE